MKTLKKRRNKLFCFIVESSDQMLDSCFDGSFNFINFFLNSELAGLDDDKDVFVSTWLCGIVGDDNLGVLGSSHA